jgi:hypothetical protein
MCCRREHHISAGSLTPVFLYCILASCYVRLTLNICSFLHQCNTFTSYILLIVGMFRPHTAIFKCYSILSRSWCSVMPISAYLCFRCYSILSRSWCSVMPISAYVIQHHIGRNLHNRAPASGEYTITLEDGRVRPKHVDD